MIFVYAVDMSEDSLYEPRVVDTEGLVGISELATHFGVTKSAVSNWPKRHPDFPAPVKTFAMGPMYLLAEVEQWYESAGTFRGDPIAA